MRETTIISSVDPGGITGGNKAKSDITFFCQKYLYYDNLNVVMYSKKKPLKKIMYTNVNLRNIIKNSEYTNYVIQYPIIDSYTFKKLMNYLFSKKNSKVYFIIHDIVSLQNNDKSIKDEELKLFNKIDGLVVHNERMREWLITQGVRTKMSVLEIFDYNNPQPLQKFNGYEGTICFPGNLFKSTFLTIPFLRQHKIDIYGPNKLDDYPSNVVYKGQYTPEELPKHLNENFGLIWDGNSVESCQGKFGEYLRYNNPHKTSLFVSSGIPIIVWEKAAIANLVKKYNIGLIIKNLEDLDEVLSKMTEQEYMVLKSNTVNLGKKLRKGYFIRKSLTSLIDNN